MTEQIPGLPRPPAADGPRGAAGVQGFSPLPTGYRLGELSVQSVLGAGDFAITYLAEQSRTAKRYVLKEYFPRALAVRDGVTIKPAPQHEPTFRWGLERFVSEARALQQLSHPALVAIHGLTQHGGTAYVGMSYEQGRDFSVWLHEHKRIAPQEELDKLLQPLIDGLATAHAGKVLHLDLGPDCIVVRDTGTPVIVDFGVFRVGLRRRLPPGDLSRLTYAAPELLSASGGPVGPWTDIYALAGLLYLAVTGKAPVPVSERARGVAMPPAAVLAKGSFRRELLDAIDTGLRMPPAQRPRTVPDWSRLLLDNRGSRLSLSRLLPRRSALPPPHATKQTAREPALLGPGEEPTPPPATPTLAASKPLAASSALLPAAAGLVAGGLIGGASSYAAAMLRTDCTGAACAAPLMLPLALAGGAFGLWEGLRHARRRAAAAALRDYDI